MPSVGPRHGHIVINGVNYAWAENMGLRWQRLLFPGESGPAVHFQAATHGNESSAPDGFWHQMVAMPLGANDPIPDDGIDGGTAAAQVLTDDGSQAGGALGLLLARGSESWHPPFDYDSPIDAPSANISDTPSPDGFLAPGDALIWSGPAMVAFHSDSPGDAAAPDLGTAHDALSRADLDPTLGATGDQMSGSDMSGVFLPPHGGDALPFGMDLDLVSAAPPLPPPPEMI